MVDGGTQHRRPGANRVLLDLMDRAGLSRAGLARRVNEGMTRRGRPTSYNHSSVTRWVGKGALPDGDAPHVLADILSERLGRPVTVAELGMPGANGRNLAAVGMEWARDLEHAVQAAVELWECGADRRELVAVVGGASAASEVALRWLVAPSDEKAAHRGGQRGVDALDVHAVRETGRHLKAIDDAHGGLAALPLGVEYLRREVTPLLRGTYDDAVGRALFGVAAEVALGVGWSAYDAAQQGLARRYMIQALRLSHAADDRLFGGRVLAAMSTRRCISATCPWPSTLRGRRAPARSGQPHPPPRRCWPPWKPARTRPAVTGPSVSARCGTPSVPSSAPTQATIRAGSTSTPVGWPGTPRGPSAISVSTPRPSSTRRSRSRCASPRTPAPACSDTRSSPPPSCRPASSMKPGPQSIAR